HGEPLTDPLGPGLPEQAAQLAREPLLAPAARALDPEALAQMLGRALTAAVVRTALDADRPVQADGDTRDAAAAAL
ncbi:MAG TPA: hypothetical protein DD420_13880, partial [Streptomyces sp.]|nr:hypothetical protein [Streptomyces sp.]